MRPYRRLTPWSLGLVRSGALFDGGDHLLQVTSLRITEEYQRFRYDEIRAVVITELPLWTVWRGVWAGAMALGVLLAMLLPTIPARVLVGMWPMAGLAMVVWALAQGRRCDAVLVSAWRTWPLPAVRTMRVAGEVMPWLSARILEAQRGLPPPRQEVSMPAVKAPAAARNPVMLWRGAAVLLAVTAAMEFTLLRPTLVRLEIAMLMLTAVPLTVVLLALVRRAADERSQRLADGLLALAVVDVVGQVIVAGLVMRLAWAVPVGALGSVAIFWRVVGAGLAIWASNRPAAGEAASG